jgi:hypothetical protein
MVALVRGRGRHSFAPRELQQAATVVPVPPVALRPKMPSEVSCVPRPLISYHHDMLLCGTLVRSSKKNCYYFSIDNFRVSAKINKRIYMSLLNFQSNLICRQISSFWICREPRCGPPSRLRYPPSQSPPRRTKVPQRLEPAALAAVGRSQQLQQCSGYCSHIAQNREPLKRK